MRKLFLDPSSKEFVLDVTRSFAYEAHHQPKRIVHKEPKVAILSLSKKLQKALRRIFGSLNRTY